MYAVVGCRECESLWIVEGRPETTQCPSCRRTYQFDDLRRLAESDDIRAARDARTDLLASRSDDVDAADVPDFDTAAADADDAVLSDEAYLEGSGIDPAQVETALDSSDTGSDSDREILQAAIEQTEPATARNIVAYAADRDVSPETAEELLETLVEAGEATRTDGRYRVL